MPIPNYYVCHFTEVCKDCGSLDKPIGYTSPSGDFIQKCQSCDFEWVAVTREEEESNARDRMEEAREIINPTLREIMRGKLR